MSKKQKKSGRGRLSARGKDAAERYLRLRGYRILERGWKCPAGEADIIAKDGECLVFVSVKTGADVTRGFPEHHVTEETRKRSEKVAAHYLSGCRDFDYPVRFDLVSLLVTADDRAFMRHHENAFGVMGC